MASSSKTDVWDRLYRKVGDLSHYKVKVGVLGGGAKATGGKISLAQLAAIHEFGAPSVNIPERSFIRGTFKESREKLEHLAERLARGILSDKISVQRALEMLGTWAVAAIQARIRAGIPPALKAATIARKGSSIPLIDTGQLLNSISYEVQR